MILADMFSQPFWEEPQRLLSPGYLTALGGLFVGWKIMQELAEFLKVVGPLFREFLEKVRDIKDSNPAVPGGPSVPAAVVVAAPTIDQQVKYTGDRFTEAQTSGDVGLQKIWADCHNALKKHTQV